MKPHLSKSERKALRFAYELMRGDHSSYLPYVHGLILRHESGRLRLLPGYWIEPDRDPDRPYLNEVIFTRLAVQGYLECQQFLPGPRWLYRLSKPGCEALGRMWPLTRISNGARQLTPQERQRQQEAFRSNRHGRNLFQERQSAPDRYRFPFQHPVYHRLFK